MAFPTAEPIIVSAWNWLGVHSLPILIVTYFVALVGVALLSFHMHSLSRRLTQLRQKAERDSRRIDQLEVSVADQASTAAVDPAVALAPKPAQSTPPCQKAELDPAALRTELESVLSELWDDQDGADHGR
jgi:hypothetical protein